MLTLPVLSSYTSSTTTNTSYWGNGSTDYLQATGSGTVLSLPELAGITVNSNAFPVDVEATAGGNIELAALKQLSASHS